MESIENLTGKEKPKKRKGQYLAVPKGAEAGLHIFEVEYEEGGIGVWKKVAGSERDLGPLKTEKKDDGGRQEE